MFLVVILFPNGLIGNKNLWIDSRIIKNDFFSKVTI